MALPYDIGKVTQRMVETGIEALSEALKVLRQNETPHQGDEGFLFEQRTGRL